MNASKNVILLRSFPLGEFYKSRVGILLGSRSPLCATLPNFQNGCFLCFCCVQNFWVHFMVMIFRFLRYLNQAFQKNRAYWQLVYFNLKQNEYFQCFFKPERYTASFWKHPLSGAATLPVCCIFIQKTFAQFANYEKNPLHSFLYGIQ